jgi:predicted O-linked N-acetylglucosamine transferase (SPINDLY family)
MLFARRPAPVQASAWGNPAGTGLQAMDYVLADAVSVPESVRHLFAEKIHNLPCTLTIEPMPRAAPTIVTDDSQPPRHLWRVQQDR